MFRVGRFTHQFDIHVAPASCQYCGLVFHVNGKQFKFLPGISHPGVAELSSIIPPSPFGLLGVPGLFTVPDIQVMRSMEVSVCTTVFVVYESTYSDPWLRGRLLGTCRGLSTHRLHRNELEGHCA
jgi:hypothetical protein